MARDEKPGEAWFVQAPPKVEGFDKADCPHGLLANVNMAYICTECGQEFVVIIVDEE